MSDQDETERNRESDDDSSFVFLPVKSDRVELNLANVSKIAEPKTVQSYVECNTQFLSTNYPGLMPLSMNNYWSDPSQLGLGKEKKESEEKCDDDESINYPVVMCAAIHDEELTVAEDSKGVDLGGDSSGDKKCDNGDHESDSEFKSYPSNSRNNRK